MRESHYAILVHNSEISQVSVLQDEHNASWKNMSRRAEAHSSVKITIFHFQPYSSA